MPARGGGLLGERAQLGRVRVRHVGEARAEALVVGAAQRVVAQQVEVIADQHQRAGRPARVEAAGGVRDDQDLRAERDSTRAGNATVAALWPSYMCTRPCIATQRAPARSPSTRRPSWPATCERGKPRDVARSRSRVAFVELVGVRAEARAEDQPDLRRRVVDRRARPRRRRPARDRRASRSSLIGSPRGCATLRTAGQGWSAGSITNAASIIARASATRPSSGGRLWWSMTLGGAFLSAIRIFFCMLHLVQLRMLGGRGDALSGTLAAGE